MNVTIDPCCNRTLDVLTSLAVGTASGTIAATILKIEPAAGAVFGCAAGIGGPLLATVSGVSCLFGSLVSVEVLKCLMTLNAEPPSENTCINQRCENIYYLCTTLPVGSAGLVLGSYAFGMAAIETAGYRSDFGSESELLMKMTGVTIGVGGAILGAGLGSYLICKKPHPLLAPAPGEMSRTEDPTAMEAGFRVSSVPYQRSEN